MKRPFGIVILAAGASTRLGRPKQLLPYLGRTLIYHVAETALASCANQVIIVVGASGQAVRDALIGLAVTIVDNPEWRSGMASSIRRGVECLGPDIECVVIALCDQPQITPEHLQNLAARHFESGSPIVASSYDGVIGAPCAFGATLFPSLMALEGDSGARELIRKSTAPIESVEFKGGIVDIDTPEDARSILGDRHASL